MKLSPQNLAASISAFLLASTELIAQLLMGEPQSAMLIVGKFLGIAVSSGLVVRLIGWVIAKLDLPGDI